MKNKLPLDAKISLFERMVEDYNFYRGQGDYCPKDQTFCFISRDEDLSITRTARVAAMNAIQPSPQINKTASLEDVERDRDLFAELLEAEQARPNNQSAISVAVQPLAEKVAFDTRRVDQETARVPRSNLQYWHRAEPFIDDKDNDQLRLFAKLMETLEGIKDDLGKDPHWFESYARVLYDTVGRTLRTKQADLDIFRPQLSYLEQLLYARYRLTMLDLEQKNAAELRRIILSKDETLMKRGDFLRNTALEADGKQQQQPQLQIDGNGKNSTQEALVNAIFGNQDFRKDGERTVERTITITIRDNVID